MTSVDVQAWGEGGSGGASVHGSRAGGGGGGGEYAENTSVPVTAGNVYSFTIGAGGTGTATTFTGDSSTTVTAHAGGTSPGQTGGSGGTGSTAPIHQDGGAGASGPAGNNQSGGGGGGSGGASGAGGAASGATGGSAGAGGGATGGAGGTSLAGGSAGSSPGGGGGGGGSGGSINHSGGTGSTGQITLTYTASTSHPGAASLSGTGTITAAWKYLGSAALTGLGTITGAGAVSTITGAALAGAGTITVSRAVTWTPAASLTGLGTLSAHTIGFSSATLAGAGTLRAVQSREFHAALTGTGTLANTGIVRGRSQILTGTGTLTVSRVLGVVTAGASRGVVTTPQAWPGSSQVAVSPPGSSQLYWLGTLGQVTALTYSYVCPGGADKMSCTVMVPATYRTQLFNPGWTVQIFRGGHKVWDGKLDEPQPTAQGWNLTAVGTGNLGQNFAAIYTSTWPAGEPDQAISAAIARGLPWVNPGVGTPSGAWYGQAVDSGSQTIADLLNLVCSRGGLLWYVNSQPGGTTGDDLSVIPLPTTPNRLLVATTPVGRTLGGDVNTIWLRYQVSADNSTTGAQATYALTSVTNAASVAAHGPMETFIDISDAGVMSAGTAQTVGNYVLNIYQRASFTGPYAVHYGDLLNMGGQAVDIGTDQAGSVAQLILTDYGFGGEVTPGPISFIVGSYEYDDFAQVATVAAYQTLNMSLSGLLSLENTLLQPPPASS